MHPHLTCPRKVAEDSPVVVERKTMVTAALSVQRGQIQRYLVHQREEFLGELLVHYLGKQQQQQTSLECS